MLELAAEDYRLRLDPARGGSIAGLDWRGEPLLRATCGPSILDSACFPLVPFSNRIAHGRFRAGGREVTIAPNLPGGDHPHPLHGFGWLAAWDVAAADAHSAMLEHRHEAGEWPWSYRARQSFRIDESGLSISLSVENLSQDAMPTGLGFHPYFPRDADTVYHSLHHGEWCNDADCLPLRLDSRAAAVDWWRQRPVGGRIVDTVYTGRDGPLTIAWPSRGRALTISLSPNLAFTVVYTPEAEDYFCVEPVSHMTDAVNQSRPDSGLVWLAPGASMSAQVTLAASSITGGTAR